LVVLHGIWHKETQRNGSFRLLIWGESDDSGIYKSGSANHNDVARVHPFCMKSTEITSAIGSRFPSCAFKDLEVSVPTAAKGNTPIRSTDSSEEGTERIMKTWSVHAISLDAIDAQRCFSILEDRKLSGDNGIRHANDLLYWMEVAKFCTELVVGQRYIPGLSNAGSELRSTWLPVINDSLNMEKLQFFGRAMPAPCIQFSEGIAKEDYLYGVICTTIDAVVRAIFSSSPEALGAEEPKLESSWISSLKSEDGRLRSLNKSESGRLEASVNDWVTPIGTSNPRAFSTAFRLRAPNEKNPGEEPTTVDSWRIDYMLQSLYDPSLIIDSSRVWNDPSSIASLVQSGSMHPQDILLRDLSVAGRLFKPIGKSLADPHPTHCSIGLSSLNKFMKETAPLLRCSGYNILLPSWLNSASKVRIEITLKGQGGSGFFGLATLAKFDWNVAIGDKRMSKEEFETLASLKSDIVNISGKWIGLDSISIEKTLNMLNGYRSVMTMKDALSLALSEGGAEFSINSDDKYLSEMLSRLSGSDSIKLLPHPGSLAAKLRPYQVSGYSWLAYLSSYGIGACLADDMGLGKTIQLIALLLNRKADMKAAEKRPSLLICPTSIVGNWSHELERFSPSIKFMVHHGTERLRKKRLLNAVAGYDLVITTYQIAHRDFKHLSQVGWDILTLDEAQNIKNSYTKQTRAVKGIGARSKIALTGTPIENRLTELWSIMDFLNPGYLGSVDRFIDEYANPIEKYRDLLKEAELSRKIRPFVLRRMKTDRKIIKDLPDKLESKVYCTLTEEQASLYQVVVDKMMEKIKSEEGIKRSGLVLNVLLRLKQICDHPSLYMPRSADEAIMGRSGKLERLEEMLDESLQNNESSLVFTQYAEMGSILSKYLKDRLNCDVMFLHGGTPRKERDALVERFQRKERPSVFVLSLKAGGFGLNLTAANHVFHYDRWWNPAVENQATDRAHRIGQEKIVNVNKFITKGTLEEKIDNMLETKSKLAEGILKGSSEAWITRLDNSQLRELFTLGG